MPIESYTGLPGHGKTSLLMERLMAEAKRENPRPLWAAGIDGLKPGLANVLADPRQWNAVKPGETCHCHDTENSAACDAHVIPNGSLIFIDEAWKWFGHLQDASRQATPSHVLQLAEHRHRGIDFVWTYQMPAQIYPFARSLCAGHQHVVRRFGSQMIDVFRWEELNEDVKSSSKRDAAQRLTRALPKAIRGHYKSAEEHTIKARIPLKVWLLPLMVVAAAALLYFAFTVLKPANMAAKMNGLSPDAGLPASGMPGSLGVNARHEEKKPITSDAYAVQQIPRFATKPWSAPLYDEREAIADPEVFCVLSGDGVDALGNWSEGRCRCISEQGTQYAMPEPQCKTIATNGPDYNPYGIKRNASLDRENASQSNEQGDRRTASASGAGTDDFRGQQSRYGQMRGDLIPADYEGSQLH